jgi:hypothetical protein
MQNCIKYWKPKSYRSFFQSQFQCALADMLIFCPTIMAKGEGLSELNYRTEIKCSTVL